MPTFIRVSVMTDTRKIGELLVLLQGKVYGKPEIDLVNGAKAVRGKQLKEVGPAGATMTDKVADLIHKSKQPRITKQMVHEALKKLGGPASLQSANNYLLYLQKQKVIGKYSKQTKDYPVRTRGE